MAGQLELITEQLSSPSSPTAIMEGCQRLTALIVANPADEWEAPVVKTVINRLLPHVTTASSSKAKDDPENVAAARTAITALCAIASHGLTSTSEELAKQGAVSAAISAAQAALLPDPLSASAEAFKMATAITRGALLPIIRDLPAALALARTRDAAAQPPLLALATLGGMVLDCCDSSRTTEQTHAVVLVLSVLQCLHAALSHGNLELLRACCHAGMSLVQLHCAGCNTESSPGRVSPAQSGSSIVSVYFNLLDLLPSFGALSKACEYLHEEVVESTNVDRCHPDTIIWIKLRTSASEPLSCRAHAAGD